MIFTSFTFLAVFLPSVLIVCFLIARFRKAGNIFLLLASLIFYTWGDLRHVWVLIASIVANYLLARAMVNGLQSNRPKLARSALVAAVVINLGLLVAFKYTLPVGDFVVRVLHHFSLPIGFQSPSLLPASPIGISFFTFSAITFILDIYRRKIVFDRSFLSTALYISFFPKLLMGPIIAYKDMASQIHHRTITLNKIYLGVQSLVIGLAKKVLIANTLAPVADQVFGSPVSQLSVGSAWIGILCFTLQIYFDFSGYSDMAIGIARMTGFDLPENFNYPYLSRSIREFWRRWHITLGRWFMEYLYIPLGGNRRAPTRVYLNLLIVFLLCGLWHNPSQTFIVWGLWHGVFMVLERANIIRLEGKLWPLAWLYSLLVVMLGWVFFRSTSLSQGLAFWSALFGFTANNTAQNVPQMLLNTRIFIALGIGVIGCTPVLPVGIKWLSGLKMKAALRYGPSVEAGFACLALIILMGVLTLSGMALAGSSFVPFIYAQF
jgi:alginate O-acetyltransferase complex protein AlgI